MQLEDDRTEEQRKTHRLAVVGRDRCLSGWGKSEDGYSRAAWAIHPNVNPDRVFNWVKSRSDMQYVNLVNLDDYRPARGTSHLHIYVVNENHPAAKH